MSQAVEELREMGWVPTTKGKGGAKPGSNLTPQGRKIWALWHALNRAGALKDGSNAACRAFITRMTGAADVRFLDRAAANKVIEALKAWQERARG